MKSKLSLSILTTLGLLTISASAAFADAQPSPASCTISGRSVELVKVTEPGASASFPKYEARLGNGLKAVASIEPGYGMLFHHLDLTSGSKTLASTTAWLPDTLGTGANVLFHPMDGFTTLSLGANLRGGDVQCSFRVVQALNESRPH